MRKLTEIIVHCSATAPRWMAGLPVADQAAEIDRWHKANGWAGIGYHFVVGRDGSIAPGRPIEKDGAHVAGRNAGTIGVCLVGGRGSAANDQPEQHYTPEQLFSLRELLHQLQAEHGPLAVSGHNQFAAKACPGFNVPRWWAHKPPRTLAQSKTIAGQVAVTVGTAGASVVELMAKDLQTAQTTLQPLVELAPVLKWVFVAVVLAGVALTVVERIHKWKRGQQ